MTFRNFDKSGHWLLKLGTLRIVNTTVDTVVSFKLVQTIRLGTYFLNK